MKTDDIVRVRGKSRHGRNRINQHGNHWVVKTVLTSKVLLESWVAGDALRWVDLIDDKDFQLMESWSK